MEREIKRDESIDTLLELINADGADVAAKEVAQEQIQEIAGYTENEVTMENMIKAKGYEDAVVFILFAPSFRRTHPKEALDIRPFQFTNDNIDYIKCYCNNHQGCNKADDVSSNLFIVILQRRNDTFADRPSIADRGMERGGVKNLKAVILR
jgi:hypothetical protein